MTCRHRIAAPMPPPTTGRVDRTPLPDAGAQLRDGPSCFGFAACNALLALGLEAPDPVAVWALACDLDGLDERTNRTTGTTGGAAVEAACRLLPGTPALWTEVPPASACEWLFHNGPLVAAIRWNYARVGLVGRTARRVPELAGGNHAVCLCGYDPAHRTGLFRKRPCYLVIDSQRRGGHRYWIPSADLHLSGDLLGAWAFVPVAASGREGGPQA